MRAKARRFKTDEAVTVTVNGQLVKGMVRFATTNKVEVVTEGRMLVIREPHQIIKGHHRLAVEVAS